MCVALGAQAAEPARQSALEFGSSNARLVEAFRWAKQQALAYVFDGDPVGPWYEAALPGRQAFCMRDVSHQSAGAHALGLAEYTENMLHRFAENIARSRDWCSYWEINRENKPAPVDYSSDSAFWYDLPANFDVLDACYRMYLWTGDRRYLDDPVFLNFYDRSVRDYVERWGLATDRVMKRQRLVPPAGQGGGRGMFATSRGIPSYIEGRSQFVLGVDLLASQYAGYVAYSRIQQQRGNAAGSAEYAAKAAAVRKLINESWWNAGTKRFYSVLTRDYKLEGPSIDTLGGGPRALLYYGAADDGARARGALEDLMDRIRKEPSGAIEEESHYPEIFYRCGFAEAAYTELMDLTRPDRQRREYPEVSYSVIGAMVSGLMGVAVEQDGAVRTLPSLGKETGWVELKNLPVRGNVITLREDNRSVTLTNQSGPALAWKAALRGEFTALLVGGKRVNAEMDRGPGGDRFSQVTATVKSGDTLRVEAPR
jgi:hypothetical protein